VGLVFPRCNRPDCFHIFYEKPPGQPPSPYDLVIEAFGGRIRGVRARDGILREVFVTPGTMLVYAAPSGEVPDIPVTETTASMQSLRASRLPRGPSGARTIIGLTLIKSGFDLKLEGVLFSPRTQTMGPAAGPTKFVARPGRPRPPRNEPTLEVSTGPTATPGEAIRLRGNGLAAGAQIEIRIDDVTVQRAMADQNGAFTAMAAAPGQVGFHVVEMVVQGKLVSGMILAVRPGD
jgi:hypothetical protein